MRNGSEDFLSFSKNEPLRLLLDVFAENDEEDDLLSSIPPHIRRENISLVQYQSNSSLMETILGEEPAGSLLCGFAFACDRHEKSFAFSLKYIFLAVFWNFCFIVQIHHKLL